MALYIIGTPIGNLNDITLRALTTLKSVPLIIAESINDSKKLANHFEIKDKEWIKYNEENKDKITEALINRLKTCDAAFITSAGMPGISDPGADLVKECRKNDIDIIAIPGVSALTTLISVSGLYAKAFTFVGFLPKTKGKIEKIISHYTDKQGCLIFFESTHRILKTLQLLNTIEPNLSIIIGKELTKSFEQILQGKPSDLISEFEKNPSLKKGEFTILIYKEKENAR